jgi:hypothetical protein
MPDVYQSPDKTDTAASTEPKKQPVNEAPHEFVPEDIVHEVLRRVGEVKRNVLFGAYNVDTGKRFFNEQKDEIEVLLLRAHPITNLGWILTSWLMLAIAVTVPFELLFPIDPKFIFVGRLVWCLLTLGYAFEKFLDWYYSVFIVTNERVVDIDFVNLLTRDVAYGTLNHIEEPNLVSGGFMQTLFRYGHIYIPTAAERSTLEALSIPYPDKVINIISELSEELEKRRERGE